MSATQILQAVATGILNGGIYSLIAAGFTLVFGVMRLVNFAHGELVVIGMYFAYVLFTLWHVGPVGAALLSIPFMAVLGILLYKSLVRRLLGVPDHLQIAATIGLSIVFQNVALALFTSDLRTVEFSWTSNVIKLAAVRIPLGALLAFGVSMVVLAVLFAVLRFTDVGKALRAAVDDADGARLVGIPVQRLYAATFAIGAVCAGIAGAITVPFLYAAPTEGLDFTLRSLAIVVVGGLGSVSGAIMAAMLVGIVESVGALFFPISSTVGLTFLILVLALLIRPHGLRGKVL
jgi:branched-chain amino acid transport system permease protein